MRVANIFKLFLFVFLICLFTAEIGFAQIKQNSTARTKESVTNEQKENIFNESDTEGKQNGTIMQLGTALNPPGAFPPMLNIGTIPPGDSIVITFEALVNTPFPTGKDSISNQGTVSGSNFASIQTDDPDDPNSSSDSTKTEIVPIIVDIGVDQLLVAKSLPVNGSATEKIGISSLQNGTLNYSIVEEGGDVPWLTESIVSGSVPGSSADTTELTLDAAGLTPGFYSAAIVINSNDTDGDIIKVFVNLNVYDPALISNTFILAVSDSAGPGNSLFLNAGIGATATDGIDPSFDENELPPPPVPGTLDARMLLPDAVTSSHNDYRNSDSLKIIWKVEFQPGDPGYPMKFLWDLTSFPEGTFTLKDAVTGLIVNVDMRTTNYFELTNNAITSLCIEYKNLKTQMVTIQSEWNLISVPYRAENMEADSLYPNASSEPFEYAGSYIQKDTLENGKGYWLKFPASEAIQITGFEVSGSVPLNTGWNLIGVHHVPVPLPVVTTPAGILVSNFFSYGAGYVTVLDTLKPGYGYWVKASAPGVMNVETGFPKSGMSKVVVKSEIKDDWGRLIITDSRNRSVPLYLAKSSSGLENFELPPVPPSGIFDARYSNDKSVLGFSDREDLDINSAVYPITIKSVGTSIKIVDKIDGSFLNAELKDGEEIKITNKLLKKFSILRTDIPVSFELSQNYPNPFNPSTKIQFAIPQPGKVNLTVYNLLGEKVVELVNKELDLGFHEVEFNAAQFASGVYFYRISSGDYVNVKKMMLLK